MKAINIFVSDKIRIHPLAFTTDGLGMAIPPYIVLDREAPDDLLMQNIQIALSHSKTEVPHRPMSKEEEKAYLEALQLRSHRDLGIGVDIVAENDQYRITPINKKGQFGNTIKVDESKLLDFVPECLDLLSAKVS